MTLDVMLSKLYLFIFIQEEKYEFRYHWNLFNGFWDLFTTHITIIKTCK